MQGISKKTLDNIINPVSEKSLVTSINDLNLKDMPRNEWLQFLKLLSQNRVLYLAANNLLKCKDLLSDEQNEDLKKILEEGNIRMEKYRDTISFLEKTLTKNNITYLVVKTFKFLDYVTFDVDVLVPYDKFEIAQEFLRKEGCSILPHPRKQGLHQRNCRKEGLLNIDLHRKFYWQGLEHIDLDLIWRLPPVLREINGVQCKCPALEIDLLLHMKQLAYERYYVTYLDFFAVNNMINSPNFDMKLVKEQVSEYGWEKTFNKTLSIIENIAGDGNETQLPFLFNYFEVWRQFFEIILSQRRTTLYDFAYYHFTFLRYLFNRNRLPYYDHWFNFKSIDSL